MNLLQQLMAANVQRVVEEPPPKRSGNPRPNAAKGYEAKRAQAEARYRKAMGTKWMRTRDIEIRLGHSISTARGVLIGMLGRGLVERRPVGGGPNFNRKEGYEWRFKDCSPSTAAQSTECPASASTSNIT